MQLLYLKENRNLIPKVIRQLPVLILFLHIWSCNSPESTEFKQEAPVSVIFDTDIQGDYDDAGALAVLHALADSDEVKILATVASNLSPLTAPTIEVINTYFNRPELLIGSPKNGGASQDSRELTWPDSLMASYPHQYTSNDDAPDAVYVYRKVLAEQADTSVTIVTVGFITNLKNLMQSGPDSLSSLNGVELIRKKVRHWVAMAGGFPEGDETNVRKDPLASQYVIDNWPTPILFSGFEIGLAIKTGLRLIEEGPEDSPIRMAYALSIPQREYDKDGRRSWDQTAVLAAIRGIEPYYTYQRGTFITSSDGTNGWKDDPQGNHRYLIFKMHPDSIGYEIENLMMHQARKSN